MSDFAIHSLRLGNGDLALGPMPGRTGQFAADVQALIAWQPSLVISMTEMAEMAAKGTETLSQSLNAAGVDWVHCPVRDYATPTDADNKRWPALSQDILARLNSGQRVFVHCMGGCGRSGMVVLRVMIDAGETPDTALARLRDVRPCAVETEAQLIWAQRGAT